MVDPCPTEDPHTWWSQFSEVIKLAEDIISKLKALDDSEIFYRNPHTIVIRSIPTSGYARDLITLTFTYETKKITVTPKGVYICKKDWTNINDLIDKLQKEESYQKKLEGRYPKICPIVMEQNKYPERLQRAKKEGRLYPLHTIHLDEFHLMGLRERWYDKEGKKHFSTFTYWTDGQLVDVEPDVLPFFNFPALYDEDTVDTVFLNEGEKAAHYMHRIIINNDNDDNEFKNHPWREDLRKGISLGWIGGANSVYRSDWQLLNKYLREKKVKRVIIVADNDKPGLDAIAEISKHIRSVKVMSLTFPEHWKKGFDIADPFPEECWKDNKYVGPSYLECLHMAPRYYYVPDEKDQLTDTLKILDKELSSVEELEPPMRDYEGRTTRVKEIKLGGLFHALNNFTNDTNEDNSEFSLQTPSILVFAPLNESALTLLIERYVQFYRQVDKYTKKNMRLPNPFVKGYMTYSDSKLPVVYAIQTMPLVLRNGILLAKNGYDRNVKIIFRIDKNLIDLLPTKPVTDDDVKEAVKFL
jgi:hypothetical protein